MSLFERDAQEAIYWYRAFKQAFPVLVPNVYLFNWESDLLLLTKSHRVFEYEIKLTKSDFKAEAFKDRKHLLLSEEGRGPARFYYVCPAELINPSEVPEYAGLLWLEKPGHRYAAYRVREIKRAKQRKVNPLSDQRVIELLQKGVARYWSLKKHRYERLGIQPSE